MPFMLRTQRKNCALSLCLVPCLMAISLLCSPLFFGGQAFAAFPTKQIELSIVFSPGGALDAAVRTLALEAEAYLGQKIIPVNRPGGGGLPGVAELAKAPADGYKLAACVSNALIFIPHKNAAPYKPLKDVVPVLTFGQASPLVTVSPQSPWQSIEALLEGAKSTDGLRVAVSGLGTPGHIALSMMAQKDPSLNFRFVPFAGPGESEAALLGGHVDAAVSGDVNRIKDGQIKALLALSSTPLPALAAVPCLADLGFEDSGMGDSTFLLLAPAGTPDDVLNTLEKAFLEASKSEKFQQVVKKYSMSIAMRGRADSHAFLRKAWSDETKILRRVGLVQEPATAPE